MGFHLCEYCSENDVGQFNRSSSGDVTLRFDNGRAWEMPDMILHYVADHGWLPPAEFVNDVMNATLVGGHRMQTKSIAPRPTRIAYLEGSFETGSVPTGFIGKLQTLMRQADRMGQRIQYRGG